MRCGGEVIKFCVTTGQVGTDKKSVIILLTEFIVFVVHPFQLDKAIIRSAGKL